MGPNNAGKSTLLQALLLLKQSLAEGAGRDTLITNGPWVGLGGFFDIVRGGQATKRPKFTISVTASPPVRRNRHPTAAPLTISDELSATFAYDTRNGEIVLSDASYRNNGEPIFSARRSGSGYTVPGVPARVRARTVMHPIAFLPRIHPIGSRPSDEQVVSDVVDHVWASEYQAYRWLDVFDNIRYVAPLRQAVPRYVLPGEPRTPAPGAGGASAIRELRNQSLLTQSSYWLSERFKILARLRLASLGPMDEVSSLVGDEVNGYTDINIANMGQGVSQLIPVVANVIRSDPHNSVLVEQPETHLHPAAQADLGELFIELASADGPQFIVETHSEHLLLRVRRKVAEGYDPNLIGILYVERGPSETTVEAIDLREDGALARWPRGFFEEGFREALALAQAASRSAAQETPTD